MATGGFRLFWSVSHPRGERPPFSNSPSSLWTGLLGLTWQRFLWPNHPSHWPGQAEGQGKIGDQFMQTSRTEQGKVYFSKREWEGCCLKKEEWMLCITSRNTYCTPSTVNVYLFFKFGSGVHFFCIAFLCKINRALNSLLTFTYIYVIAHHLGSIIISPFAFLFLLDSLRAETILFLFDPIYSYSQQILTERVLNARKVVEFNMHTVSTLRKLIFNGEDKLTKKELQSMCWILWQVFKGTARTDMETVSEVAWWRVEWRWELTVSGRARACLKPLRQEVIPWVFKELNLIQNRNSGQRPDLKCIICCFSCLDFCLKDSGQRVSVRGRMWPYLHCHSFLPRYGKETEEEQDQRLM